MWCERVSIQCSIHERQSLSVDVAITDQHTGWATFTVLEIENVSVGSNDNCL